MSKTNMDICHDFFYAEGRYYNPRSKNVGYSNNVFYSYDTAIAKLVKNKFGDTICLMSCEGFSNTTRKQMSYLRRACRFEIIEVPVSMGNVVFDAKSISSGDEVSLRFKDGIADATINSIRISRKEKNNEK